MDNNKKRMPHIDRLRLKIDIFSLVLLGFAAGVVGYFPPADALFPPHAFIFGTALLLLLHAYGLLRSAPQLVMLVEWLVLGLGFVMWVIVWLNGELATIILPAFIAFSAIYGLVRNRFLFVYSAGSFLLLALTLFYRPDFDAAIVGRSMITLISVVVLLVFLKAHLQQLAETQLKQERLEGTLKAILKAAKIDVFDERVKDGSGFFIHSHHAPDVSFVGGKKRLELVDPQFRTELAKNLTELNVPTEFKFILPRDEESDSYRWYRQQTVYEYMDDRGDLHRIGFSQDIQDEVSTRQVLNRALAEQGEKQRLIEAEIEKFNTVCDELELVYWRLSLDDWSLVYNRRFAQRWDLEVGGTLAFDELSSFMHDDYISFHKNAVDTVINTRSRYKTRYCAPAGPRQGRWFELNYWPSFDTTGELFAVNVANVEVTDLMTAQAELRDKHEELLRQQLREKDMYAVIGHEMRTPAAILKMQLEQEKRGLGDVDRKLFEASVDQLLGVVDTLRTVSQPDQIASRDLSVQLLSELLGNQISILQTLSQEAGIKLFSDFECPQERPVLLMAGPLKQLISNLLKNAIIHSGASEVKLTAENAYLDAEHQRIRIRVDDNGKGIPADDVERLFEPYERGTGSANGTGLGLYICREIARIMEADLRYEPSASGGASFVLEWTAAIAPPVAESIAAVGLPVEDPLSALSVLLVEDDVGILQMTATLLTGECGRLRIAKNGTQALDILADSEIDLVLTDIFMPQMNGIELVAEMRHRGYTVPVIGLTAATLGHETHSLLEAGANEVLNKPIEINQLKSRVKALIGSGELTAPER